MSDHVLRNWQHYSVRPRKRPGSTLREQHPILTATRAIEVADLKAIMHAMLTCFLYHHTSEDAAFSSGTASEHRRITSGGKALATCSSVYAKAGVIVRTAASTAR